MSRFTSLEKGAITKGILEILMNSKIPLVDSLENNEFSD